VRLTNEKEGEEGEKEGKRIMRRGKGKEKGRRGWANVRATKGQILFVRSIHTQL